MSLHLLVGSILRRFRPGAGFAAAALAVVILFYAWICARPDAMWLCVGVISAGCLGMLTQLTLKAKVQCPPAHDGRDQPLVTVPTRTGGELLAVQNCLSMGLRRIAQQPDALFQELASLSLDAITENVRTLADGKIVFHDTESWRTAYERVLRSPGLKRYFSVAWFRSEDYWRDSPGRRSMQLNYDLIQLGLRIERTLVLSDFFWPPAALLPAKIICQWIEEQYKRGIVIRLVRESDVAEEPNLLCDFGIYGDRATGLLELDDQCRTVRFTLDFAPRAVQLFEERWRRLLLFAITFRELLDRKARGR
jgi:hypothetical protein